MQYVRLLNIIEPYKSGTALGLSSVHMSENKQYILAGYHDEKLRLINSLSWSELFAFDHSWEELTELNSSEFLNIYRESESKDGVFFEAMSRPFKVPRTTP